MPVTKTITLYKFDELSETAKDKAIEKLWDINVDYNWWDHIYSDAEVIGLHITGFSLDNRKEITGVFTEYVPEICRNIRGNHGKECETFKTAQAYLKDYIEAFVKWKEQYKKYNEDDTMDWKPKDWLDLFKYTDEAADVVKEFKNALLEDYLSMLEKEYDYQTSRERIVESIEANEYLFHEDGTLE